MSAVFAAERFDISPLIWLGAGVAAFLLIWLIYCLMLVNDDRPAIRSHLVSQKATLISARRFRELADCMMEPALRVYHIRYRDGHGWRHAAVCRANHDGDLLFTEDRILHEPHPKETFPPHAVKDRKAVTEIQKRPAA